MMTVARLKKLRRVSPRTSASGATHCSISAAAGTASSVDDAVAAASNARPVGTDAVAVLSRFFVSRESAPAPRTPVLRDAVTKTKPPKTAIATTAIAMMREVLMM